MTDTEGRRCALPGCYVVIEPEAEGQPRRKYCTAAHRAVARQMRREGTHRSASAPPLPLPTPPLPLPPLAPLPGAGVRARQLAEAAGRRARAIAVLGSAGLLVTGGGLMAASSPIGAPTSAIAGAPWLAATPEAEQQWAREARVTLTAVETQLNELTQTEQSWNSLPATERGDTVPAAVRALSGRRTLLEQQRATLVSELAIWQSMRDADSRLVDTERHVARLDDALKDVPRNRRLSADEMHTAQQLTEQRSMRVRQRDSQRQELDSLRQGLREAMAVPLPEDDGATKALTSRVSEIVKNPGKHRGNDQDPLSNQPKRPDVLAQRDRPDPGRWDVGNGAPPNPGRTRPEIPGQPDILASPGQPRGGSLGDAADGVGKSLPQIGAPHAPGAPSVGVPGVGVPGVPGLPGAPAAPGGRAGPGAPHAPGPAAPNQPGTLGGAVDGTVGGLSKALPGNPGTPGAPGAPGAPAAPPGGAATPGAPGKATPNQSGPLGGVLASPTRPLDGSTAQPGDRAGADTPGRRRGGVLDNPINRPFDRVSEDTFIGPTESSAPRSAPSAPRRTSPVPRVEPQTYLVPTEAENAPTTGSSSPGGYSERQKAQDAARIANAVSDGDLGDMFSAAMKAKQHERAAKEGGGSYSSGGSSSSGDAIDRTLAEYGVDDAPSSNRGSGGSKSKSSGGSRSGSGDAVDQALAEYGVDDSPSSGKRSSSGSGSTSKSRSSSGSSSGSGDAVDQALAEYGGDGSSSSGRHSRSSSSSSGDSKGSKRDRGSSSSGGGDFDGLIDSYLGGGSGSKSSKSSRSDSDSHESSSKKKSNRDKGDSDSFSSGFDKVFAKYSSSGSKRSHDKGDSNKGDSDSGKKYESKSKGGDSDSGGDWFSSSSSKKDKSDRGSKSKDD